MEPPARDDQTMDKTTMRGKSLLVVEMFALAEVMRVGVATTKS